MGNGDVVLELLRRTDAGDADGFVAGMKRDCEWETPNASLRGRDAVREYVRGFHGAFPGARHDVTSVVEDGEIVALEGVWVARHTGPLATPDGEVPPTGNEVHLPFGAHVRVCDGVVAATHVYFDQLTFMEALDLTAAGGESGLDLVERVRRAFETTDLDAFETLLAPDSEVVNPFATMRGPAEFRALAEGFTAAFTELQIEIVSAVEGRDAVAVELEVRARHTGPLFLPGGSEIAPTGLPMSFREAGIVRIESGRIASWHSYYDVQALLAQLMPEGAAVA